MRSAAIDLQRLLNQATRSADASSSLQRESPRLARSELSGDQQLSLFTGNR